MQRVAGDESQEWLSGADPEILPPAVRTAFPILDGALELRPIGGGLLHQSFHARLADSEFILQRVSDVFAPEIHDNIHRVSSHLAARGFRSATLLPTVDGQYSVDLGTLGRWRLMPHLGGVSFTRVQSLAQARSAGLLVGRFHAALRDFEQTLAPMGIPYRDTALYLKLLRSALDANPGHRLSGDILPLGNRILSTFVDLGTPVDAPDCVIHGDLKLQNLLFETATGPGRDRAFALVDMDTLMRAPLWVEMGDAWRSWCNPDGENAGEARFDLEIFEASLRGFVEGLGRALSVPERRSLASAPERVTLELCARYATDALEERYFGWDEDRFPARGEHNRLRASVQWQLFEAARASRKEREQILSDVS